MSFAYKYTSNICKPVVGINKKKDNHSDTTFTRRTQRDNKSKRSLAIGFPSG